jgi:phosphatase and actin regulator 4
MQISWKRCCHFAEPKKDKADQANGSLSPSSEPPGGPTLLSPGGGGSGGGADSGSAAAVGVGKPERPSTLAPGKLTRRLLCYHSEHCMSHNSPPRVGALVAAAATTGESPPMHSVAVCCG